MNSAFFTDYCTSAEHFVDENENNIIIMTGKGVHTIISFIEYHEPPLLRGGQPPPNNIIKMNGIKYSMHMSDIFTTVCRAVKTMTVALKTYFVAVGEGTNAIAISDDGIKWTGCGDDPGALFGANPLPLPHPLADYRRLVCMHIQDNTIYGNLIHKDGTLQGIEINITPGPPPITITGLTPVDAVFGKFMDRVLMSDTEQYRTIYYPHSAYRLRYDKFTQTQILISEPSKATVNTLSIPDTLFEINKDLYQGKTQYNNIVESLPSITPPKLQAPFIRGPLALNPQAQTQFDNLANTVGAIGSGHMAAGNSQDFMDLHSFIEQEHNNIFPDAPPLPLPPPSPLLLYTDGKPNKHLIHHQLMHNYDANERFKYLPAQFAEEKDLTILGTVGSNINYIHDALDNSTIILGDKMGQRILPLVPPAAQRTLSVDLGLARMSNCLWADSAGCLQVYGGNGNYSLVTMYKDKIINLSNDFDECYYVKYLSALGIWMAFGKGKYTAAYSVDGITWGALVNKNVYPQIQQIKEIVCSTDEMNNAILCAFLGEQRTSVMDYKMEYLDKDDILAVAYQKLAIDITSYPLRKNSCNSSMFGKYDVIFVNDGIYPIQGASNYLTIMNDSSKIYSTSTTLNDYILSGLIGEEVHQLVMQFMNKFIINPSLIDKAGKRYILSEQTDSIVEYDFSDSDIIRKESKLNYYHTAANTPGLRSYNIIGRKIISEIIHLILSNIIYKISLEFKTKNFENVRGQQKYSKIINKLFNQLESNFTLIFPTLNIGKTYFDNEQDSPLLFLNCFEHARSVLLKNIDPEESEKSSHRIEELKNWIDNATMEIDKNYYYNLICDRIHYYVIYFMERFGNQYTIATPSCAKGGWHLKEILESHWKILKEANVTGNDLTLGGLAGIGTTPAGIAQIFQDFLDGILPVPGLSGIVNKYSKDEDYHEDMKKSLDNILKINPDPNPPALPHIPPQHPEADNIDALLKKWNDKILPLRMLQMILKSSLYMLSSNQYIYTDLKYTGVLSENNFEGIDDVNTRQILPIVYEKLTQAEKQLCFDNFHRDVLNIVQHMYTIILEIETYAPEFIEKLNSVRYSQENEEGYHPETLQSYTPRQLLIDYNNLLINVKEFSDDRLYCDINTERKIPDHYKLNGAINDIDKLYTISTLCVGLCNVYVRFKDCLTRHKQICMSTVDIQDYNVLYNNIYKIDAKDEQLLYMFFKKIELTAFAIPNYPQLNLLDGKDTHDFISMYISENHSDAGARRVLAPHVGIKNLCQHIKKRGCNPSYVKSIVALFSEQFYPNTTTKNLHNIPKYYEDFLKKNYHLFPLNNTSLFFQRYIAPTFTPIPLGLPDAVTLSRNITAAITAAINADVIDSLAEYYSNFHDAIMMFDNPSATYSYKCSINKIIKYAIANETRPLNTIKNLINKICLAQNSNTWNFSILCLRTIIVAIEVKLREIIFEKKKKILEAQLKNIIDTIQNNEALLTAVAGSAFQTTFNAIDTMKTTTLSTATSANFETFCKDYRTQCDNLITAYKTVKYNLFNNPPGVIAALTILNYDNVVVDNFVKKIKICETIKADDVYDCCKYLIDRKKYIVVNDITNKTHADALVRAAEGMVEPLHFKKILRLLGQTCIYETLKNPPINGLDSHPNIKDTINIRKEENVKDLCKESFAQECNNMSFFTFSYGERILGDMWRRLEYYSKVYHNQEVMTKVYTNNDEHYSVSYISEVIVRLCLMQIFSENERMSSLFFIILLRLLDQQFAADEVTALCEQFFDFHLPAVIAFDDFYALHEALFKKIAVPTVKGILNGTIDTNADNITTATLDTDYNAHIPTPVPQIIAGNVIQTNIPKIIGPTIPFQDFRKSLTEFNIKCTDPNSIIFATHAQDVSIQKFLLKICEEKNIPLLIQYRKLRLRIMEILYPVTTKLLLKILPEDYRLMNAIYKCENAEIDQLIKNVSILVRDELKQLSENKINISNKYEKSVFNKMDRIKYLEEESKKYPKEKTYLDEEIKAIGIDITNLKLKILNNNEEIYVKGLNNYDIMRMNSSENIPSCAYIHENNDINSLRDEFEGKIRVTPNNIINLFIYNLNEFTLKNGNNSWKNLVNNHTLFFQPDHLNDVVTFLNTDYEFVDKENNFFRIYLCYMIESLKYNSITNIFGNYTGNLKVSPNMNSLTKLLDIDRKKRNNDLQRLSTTIANLVFYDEPLPATLPVYADSSPTSEIYFSVYKHP